VPTASVNTAPEAEPEAEEDTRESDEDAPESGEVGQVSLKLTGQGCNNSGPGPAELEWVSKTMNGVKTERPCGARLNFLFLVLDSIYQVDVWKDFFEDAPPGSWTAWVHCANRTGCQREVMKDALGPSLRVVRTVETKYCHDLVTAEAHLMREALRKTAQQPTINNKYVLVSESTLPAKPFALMYKALTAYEESDFCFSQASFWPEGNFVYENRPNEGLKVARGGKLRSLLPRHSQFVILNTADARFFASTWKEPDPNFGWIVPLKSKRWKRQGNTTYIYSNDFLQYHDPNRVWKGFCADETAIFTVIMGTFEPGDWKGECPLNRSTRCNSLKSLMRMRRCRTFSAGPQNSFVQSLMNDSNTTLLLPKHWQAGHGVKMLQLGNASMKRIRSSHYLFARKFLPSSRIPHYSDLVLRS